MKSIVYHFRVRGTGAEGVHIAGIVNGFRACGYSVHMVSPTGVDPTEQSLSREKTEIKRYSLVSKFLHKMADILPQPFFEAMELAYNFVAVPKLWRAIREEKPDFIYERYAFFNFSGALMARLLNVPLVVEVNEISGHKRVRGQYFLGLAGLVERRVFRTAVVVITVSDFLQHEIKQKVGRDIEVMTIPNGVPQSWIQKLPDEQTVHDLRRQLNLLDKKVVCFIGGLVHWHNFDMLLEVIGMVQKELPETVLLIVGDGPLHEHIEQTVSRLRLCAESVRMIGKVPHAEIPLYIKMSDVAIIPETNDFRSPIKMFEYMSMARPVVAPRMPPIQAIITNGRDGQLFEPGNKTSCRDALLQVLINPEYAHVLGQAAYEKIIAHYTWEKHAQEILSIMSST